MVFTPDFTDPSGLLGGGIINFGPEVDQTDCQEDLIEKGEKRIEELIRREKEAAITEATVNDCSGTRYINGRINRRCSRDKRLEEYRNAVNKARKEYLRYLDRIAKYIDCNASKCAITTWKEWLKGRGLDAAPKQKKR